MKSSFNRTVAGLGAFAVVGGAFLGFASSASAADSPLPWMATELSTANGFAEQQGTLTFYDADGNLITSGALDAAPFAAYAVASGGLIDGDTNAAGATALMYTPAASDPALWGNTQISVTAPLGPGTNDQYTALPADIRSSDREVVPLALDVNTAISGFPSSYPAPNDKVYEVRVIGDTDQKWYSADIEIDPATNTWTQIYPVAAAATATSISAITADPASPAPSATTSVALSATLSAEDGTHPDGAVELFDGATDLGPATLDAATGAITADATVSEGGSYNFQFKYTATGDYADSSSAALAYSVTGAPKATTTVVTGPTSATAGTAVTYTATVAAAGSTPTGTVQFKVDGSNSGSPVALTGGAATKLIAFATPGDHTVTASYVPQGNFVASSDDTGIAVTVAAGTGTQGEPDPQTVTVNVPEGTIAISTPYTPESPLDLGELALNADGTAFDSAAVPFDKVTITDTRANSQGWNASAGTTDFDNGSGSTISGDLLTFTGVTPDYITDNNIASGDVTTTDITANFTTAQEFARTAVGPGSVYVTGNMQLNEVPTSVIAGDYTATVTFTIVGH